MNSSLQCLSFKKLLLPFCFFVCTIALCIPANAQEKPPRPIVIKVETARHLEFGTIVPTNDSGGSVTVDISGNQTPSGYVFIVPSGGLGKSALFQVYVIPGTLITINPIPDSKICNGSFCMNLELGVPSTGYTFITKNDPTDVFIGGKLTIGSMAANPAGSYIGYFTVTFNQQ
jgi:hypothetical protein